MKLKTEEVKRLNNWIGTLSGTIEKVTFRVDNDGLRQRSRDPAHICMINFEMDKSDFSYLQVKGKEEVFTVDSTDLSQILGRLKKRDEISLESTDSQLVITAEDGGKKEFSIPLLTKKLEEEQDLSQLTFDARADITISSLRDELKNVALMGEHVGFKIENDELTIYSTEGQGEYKSVFSADDIEKLDSQTSAESRFQIGYLQDALKPLRKEGIVKINLSTEAPVKLTSDEGDSSISGYFAPIAGGS